MLGSAGQTPVAVACLPRLANSGARTALGGAADPDLARGRVRGPSPKAWKSRAVPEPASVALQTLISLLDMYERASQLGCPRPIAIAGEFWSYHLIMLMGFKQTKMQFVTTLQVGPKALKP